MVRLEDIGQVAGVSIKTVSRSLRGEGYVAPGTRARVLKVAGQMGYRPNLAARSLRSRRTHQVSLVVWSMDPFMEMGDIYLEKIEGLEERLHEANLPLTIRTAHLDYRAPVYPEKVIAELKAEGSLGVALFPLHLAILRRCVEELESAGIPTVVLDAPVEQGGFDNVAVNRSYGVREAVLYLHRQGHRRIGYLGLDEVPSRLKGYEGGLKEVGLEPIYYFVPVCHTGEQLFLQGRTAAKNLLNLPQRPDAIQAYSDPLAIGLINGLKEIGVRVPEDIAVVGFDNRRSAVYVSPRLTTVAHPNREVGRAGAEILLRKIANEPRPPTGWSQSFPTRLVVRESA